MRDLYRNAAQNAESGFSFDDKALAESLERIYRQQFDPKHEIDKELFEAIWSTVNQATETGFNTVATDRDQDFLQALKTNNAVFAAFKTHRMQNDIAGQLLDENGQLKPFSQFKADTAGMVGHHVDRWLRTEYDTAVIRAHQAADWQQFMREKDILPNLRWNESTSLEPRASHRVFWNRIWSIDDPFWTKHRPGDEWGCKCSLSSTDEPVTDNSDLQVDIDPPVPGLGGNPGVTAKIFSDDHPYIKNAYKGAKSAVKNLLKEIEAKEAEVIKKSKDWASVLTEKDSIEVAEDAAKKLLRSVDLDLPRIKAADLGRKTKRGLVQANYSAAANQILVNNNAAIKKAGGLSRLGKDAAGWGWSSQENPILHELGHHIHKQIDNNYSRVENQWSIDGKERRAFIKENLSEYACTNPAEFEAELISGILSGKRYPSGIMDQSILKTLRDRDPNAAKLYEMGLKNQEQ